jgi:hypothetical protein
MTDNRMTRLITPAAGRKEGCQVIGLEQVGNKIEARSKVYARIDQPISSADARRLVLKISRETNTKPPLPDVLGKLAYERVRITPKAEWLLAETAVVQAN